MDIQLGSFIWNSEREEQNILKHGVSFGEAAEAFRDPFKRIFKDERHSHLEERFFCIAKVGKKIITVRFTLRADKIRIFGAGYWRKGGQYYNEKRY